MGFGIGGWKTLIAGAFLPKASNVVSYSVFLDFNFFFHLPIHGYHLFFQLSLYILSWHIIYLTINESDKKKLEKNPRKQRKQQCYYGFVVSISSTKSHSQENPFKAPWIQIQKAQNYFFDTNPNWLQEIAFLNWVLSLTNLIHNFN